MKKGEVGFYAPSFFNEKYWFKGAFDSDLWLKDLNSRIEKAKKRLNRK